MLTQLFLNPMRKTLRFREIPLWPRVPGLPIAGISNNLVPRGTKVSAIDVRAKTFFDRCTWFQDLVHLSPESTVSVLPHPNRWINNYFSISVQFEWPLNFLVMTIHQAI